MMERSPNFIYWQGGDNTRQAGKMQVHNRLAFDGRVLKFTHQELITSPGIRCAEAGGH